MIQSNIMKEETKKCEDTAKYSITGSITYKKKKICINRHIIKYYVITEYSSMELLWRLILESERRFF